MPGWPHRRPASLVQAGLRAPLSESLWDTSWLLDEGSIIGPFLHVLIGCVSGPAGVQVLAYVLTPAIIGTLVATIGRDFGNFYTIALSALPRGR